MRRRSRLPRKTVCLSSSSRSASRARSRTSCAEKGTSPPSVEILRDRPARRMDAGEQATERIMTTTFDMNDLKRRMAGAIAALKQELSGLRTGRASTALLDHVQVEAYGNNMPLNQLSTISVPEPPLLNVQ